MRPKFRLDYDAWLLRGSESGVLSSQEERWLEEYAEEELEGDLAEWLRLNPDKSEDDFYTCGEYDRLQERYLERRQEEWDNYDPY